ncbi:CYTH domain-containing protein [Streptomyces lavendulocolor]|uniref:adenylate cyclase n=1 Tax=Streptomyces lavendulocolor TaxID=67316 RepID=UPI0031E0418A
MQVEIERKFQVLDGWEIPPGAGVVLIRQAYLTDPAPAVEVRVRSMDDRYFMTVKKPVETSGGKALARHEVEFPIGASVFEPLWEMASARLEKERWTVPCEGCSPVVDVYRGNNLGLRVAEVEFTTPEAADAFVPPAWFGPEITGVKRWGNRALAQPPTAG